MKPTEDQAKPTANLADLPLDELLGYGRDLGLTLSVKLPQGEVLRLIRDRQALLSELDREALLDIVRWMRVPVRQSAGREVLMKVIARNRGVTFDSLSDRGLAVLVRLRGLKPPPTATRHEIIKLFCKGETWTERLKRKRGEWTSGFVSHFIPGVDDPSGSTYRYLPEDADDAHVRQPPEHDGVVGGIARRLRGVADDYVREKLDEIEARIDRKLDEIDRRLGEWRDREVAHRLRILKITLFVSILVALLSLLYHYSVTAS